jgi:GT2 family glycosyltransferase
MTENAPTTGESIFAVVLSYNGLADSRKCLASLEAAVRPGVTPALVDNGSTDGTAEAVAREFPWCRIVRVDVNRGPVGGNNAGIEAALASGARWVMLLNNDITVDPLLFETMAEAAAANPSFDALGPVIFFMDDPSVVMTDGCMFNLPGSRGFFIRKEVPLADSRPPRATEVDIVNGCCMMIRADMLRRIGGFDERIFMYHDEADLCLRIREAGGRLGVIDHGLIWHKGSASSRATGKKSIRYFDARNLWYVLKKHRGAATHGRGGLATRLAYFRYMFYWYAAEKQEGNTASAEAVIDGVVDAFGAVTGPYEPTRRRRFRSTVRQAFEAASLLDRWRHGGRPAQPELH